MFLFKLNTKSFEGFSNNAFWRCLAAVLSAAIKGAKARRSPSKRRGDDLECFVASLANQLHALALLILAGAFVRTRHTPAFRGFTFADLERDATDRASAGQSPALTGRNASSRTIDFVLAGKLLAALWANPCRALYSLGIELEVASVRAKLIGMFPMARWRKCLSAPLADVRGQWLDLDRSRAFVGAIRPGLFVCHEVSATDGTNLGVGKTTRHAKPPSKVSLVSGSVGGATLGFACSESMISQLLAHTCIVPQEKGTN